MMKKIKTIVLAIVVSCSFFACEDMLDPTLDGTLKEDAVWGNTVLAFGFLNNAYNSLPSGYNRISGAMLEAATDDAVCPSALSDILDFNNGTWGPFKVIDNVWNKNYEGIRIVNKFLENIDAVPLPKQSNSLGTDESILNTRERMKGEARFLRAYFYFELVKRYGGVPIVDKTLTTEEAINIQRSTVDQCFDFIINDCETAAQMLPTKYGLKPTVIGFNEGKDIGRATKGAALALKSRALLYWASPLFNTSGNSTRWEQAAQAAADVLNLKVNADNTGANVYKLINFTSTINESNLFSVATGLSLYHDEVVFSTSYNDNTTVERQNAPISYGGQGLTNPTQNLVDAFPMSNGKEITDATSGYNPADPYKNRDPRLLQTVLTNGTNFTVNDKTAVLETFNGGVDGPTAYQNASQTGYYLQKFLVPAAVWDNRSVTISRTWVLIRFAELYLNYAEATNEAYGPNAEVYAALKALRTRAGFTVKDIQAGLTKDQMRKVIQNERRIELAFEEHRFFDVRRWKLFDDTAERNKLLTIRGISIEKDANNNFIYNSKVVENRIFMDKMYFYPISNSELMKSSGLVQNPGW